MKQTSIKANVCEEKIIKKGMECGTVCCKKMLSIAAHNNNNKNNNEKRKKCSWREMKTIQIYRHFARVAYLCHGLIPTLFTFSSLSHSFAFEM
jgi:hypothetical protein